MAAKMRRLGKSGIEVTPIGLGTWQFSEGKGGATGMWAAIAQKETDEIVKAASDGGINWFDTAEMYGFGRSERALSHGLQAAGVSVGHAVIATKWSPFLRTASSIRKTIGSRISNLSPYHLDLHQIHFPASLSSRKAEMDAMADLLDAHKIRAVGVSNFSAPQMRKAHAALETRGYPLASNQVRYSLLDRSIEGNGVLDAAVELGTTIIAYSPLEMGLLTGKFHKDPGLLGRIPLMRRMRLKKEIEGSRPLVEALDAVAKSHEASVSQVALAWTVGFHGETIVAIPGASKASQAQESAKAMGLRLSSDEMASIDELSATVT
ncbi:MAG: aldo/keto reductase [Candidatus Altiarchaeota archaeon]